MRVYLSRIDIAVTEHHLHRSQVRPVLDQRRGEAVTQHVRGDMTEGGRLPVDSDNPPKFLAGDGASSRLDEKHVGMFPLQQSLPDGQIAPQEMYRGLPDRNPSLLTSLPETAQRPGFKLHVREPEADQFGGSKAGGVKEF